jgi:hypothetical protein
MSVDYEGKYKNQYETVYEGLKNNPLFVVPATGRRLVSWEPHWTAATGPEFHSAVLAPNWLMNLMVHCFQ